MTVFGERWLLLEHIRTALGDSDIYPLNPDTYLRFVVYPECVRNIIYTGLAGRSLLSPEPIDRPNHILSMRVLFDKNTVEMGAALYPLK